MPLLLKSIICAVVIIALLIMIGITIDQFRKLDRAAAILLVPYLLWVSYATYLNAGYLVLNHAVPPSTAAGPDPR
jgi:tryptophan-rich sensory protein